MSAGLMAWAILQRNTVSHWHEVATRTGISHRNPTYEIRIFNRLNIAEGKVKKYKLDQAGKEHIIYVADAGDPF